VFQFNSTIRSSEETTEITATELKPHSSEIHGWQDIYLEFWLAF
jgi:hypothetical protein